MKANHLPAVDPEGSADGDDFQAHHDRRPSFSSCIPFQHSLYFNEYHPPLTSDAFSQSATRAIWLSSGQEARGSDRMTSTSDRDADLVNSLQRGNSASILMLDNLVILATGVDSDGFQKLSEQSSWRCLTGAMKFPVQRNLCKIRVISSAVDRLLWETLF